MVHASCHVSGAMHIAHYDLATTMPFTWKQKDEYSLSIKVRTLCSYPFVNLFDFTVRIGKHVISFLNFAFHFFFCIIFDLFNFFTFNSINLSLNLFLDWNKTQENSFGKKLLLNYFNIEQTCENFYLSLFSFFFLDSKLKERRKFLSMNETIIYSIYLIATIISFV